MVPAVMKNKRNGYDIIENIGHFVIKDIKTSGGQQDTVLYNVDTCYKEKYSTLNFIEKAHFYRNDDPDA